MKTENHTPFILETMPGKGPEDKDILTIIVKGTFEPVPYEPAKIARDQIPVFYGDELTDEENGGSLRFESDIAPFKPKADIALVGKAYAPGGESAFAIDVSLKVGHTEKTIRVIGDRYWRCPSRFLPVIFTKPKPFVMMDLVYEKAFGGVDEKGGGYCPENLAGCGYYKKKRKNILNNGRLPNLEDPENLIRYWNDYPFPACFGFFSKAWMPRAKFAGTYDEMWKAKRAPEPPEDFRFEYYNAAHPDLQVKGYLKGDEKVEMINLTPEGRLVFRLSGIFVTCKAVISSFAGGPVEKREEDIAMNLDTLCFMPDEEKFYQVWRGICPLDDPLSWQVDDVSVQYEIL